MGALHTIGEGFLGHGAASAMIGGIEQEEIRCSIVNVYKDIVELYQPSMNVLRWFRFHNRDLVVWIWREPDQGFGILNFELDLDLCVTSRGSNYGFRLLRGLFHGDARARTESATQVTRFTFRPQRSADGLEKDVRNTTLEGRSMVVYLSETDKHMVDLGMQLSWEPRL